jgi:myo-inositol 2-dehydrogenase/D-chiro-inositol 1-dehydrogenase
MSNYEPINHGLYVPKNSRRDFLRGSIAAGTAAVMSSATHAFAAGSDEIKIGLIGCGGRGSGAASQALSSGNYNFKLWAMGDAHQDRLDSAHKGLADKHKEQFSVPDARKFVGLDAYERVIASCDLVILATPPGFRPYHFEAAINAGKHVFMEKPVAVDAPGVRKVLEVAKIADQKGLKVVAGLQRRYQNCYREALKQVKEQNIIGDIVGGQVYWNSGGVWVKDREAGQTELQYQLRNWYYFNWLCGDHINEQHIHNIDVANWFIGEHPVSAQGMGGRQVRTGKEFGEIFDHHYVEFTYSNGVRINSQCRHQKNCENPVREELTGTKGILYLTDADKGSRIQAVDYKGNVIWRYDRKLAAADPNPYNTEHNELQDAILNGKNINNAYYVAESTMSAIMGRFATYTGKDIKWEQALNSQQQLMPNKVTWDTEPPSKPDENGFYPIATPGVTKLV